MAHNIYKELFMSKREPAWHGLGKVFTEDLTAIQASEQMDIPKIYTEGVQTLSGLVSPTHKAICCIDPSEQDPSKVKKVLSIVSEGYNEITHFDFIQAWDRATNGASIETIGVLAGGSTLFISTLLPAWDVKGDPVRNYLLAFNPLDGKTATTGRETIVRVVCENTLNFSASNMVQQFRAIHVGENASIQQIESWMKNLWDSRHMQADTIKEAMEILASKHIDSVTAGIVTNKVYPNTEQPTVKPSNDKELKLAASIEEFNKKQKIHREGVYNLWEGLGKGQGLESCKGTAYGLYNATSEYESYMRKYGKKASAFVGAGAQRVETAFDACMKA